MTKPTVLVTEQLAPAPLAWLKEHARVIESGPTDEHLARARGLVVRTYTTVDDALLERAPNLRVVARAGVGLDNIDLEACERRGISVVSTPHANGDAVTEFVGAMILRTIRPIEPLGDQNLDLDAWSELRTKSVSARSSQGETLGVLGLGNIGTKVATLGAALSMRVRYTDLVDIPHARDIGAQRVELDELLRTSTVLSVHVDGRAENAKLLGRDQFELLRPDVVLLNTSRGFVIDESAAADFARANAGATLVLDVHGHEPIGPQGPLNGIPNVIRTPHIAAGTARAKEAMSWVVRDLVRELEG